MGGTRASCGMHLASPGGLASAILLAWMLIAAGGVCGASLETRDLAELSLEQLSTIVVT